MTDMGSWISSILVNVPPRLFDAWTPSWTIDRLQASRNPEIILASLPRLFMSPAADRGGATRSPRGPPRVQMTGKPKREFRGLPVGVRSTTVAAGEGHV
ncbi:hypothetical protein N7462_007247 [Penicillium macrosclerotiorum]|uniref:uncharacterized protein n=1 Tax=Penicillium macrosclerotiorum TaxID=303699 RepID=UPI002549621B|nr:uncharacterized protein N7462_007247 [Penicillium macrosclerotiorum]KAJ5679003.1 hypothetical protein N7462_007247 [Penicillium macrosclerotiorum]